MSTLRKLFCAGMLLPAALLMPAVLLHASSITGTVTNGTTKKPSAGDTVTLIRLAQGMQEATHTTTDARGRFTLDVPDEGVHLVRVTHDKANYFKPAPPGTTSVDVDVYTAAARVPGVLTEAIVMRLQTDESGKNLTVVQNFFLKNDSDPPRTQFSERAFEFTLPEGAVVEGAAAQGTGGMTVQSPPVPLPEKGHYAFVFPIRPGGETRFQVSYRLPYAGSLTFAPLATLPTDNVVVMMAKSMKFEGGSTFAPIQDEVNAQTYVARGVAEGKQVSFTVSGTGQLPRTTETGTGQPQDAAGAGGAGAGQPAAGAGDDAATGAGTAPDRRPGGGLGNPIDTPDPLSKYKWWIIGGLSLLLVAGAGYVFSRPQGALPTAAESASLPAQAPAIAAGGTGSAPLLAVLRDELFTLESDRLTGKVNPEEYNRLKNALEVVLQHALTRGKEAA